MWKVYAQELRPVYGRAVHKKKIQVKELAWKFIVER